jgi:3-dehydroquinate synthase
VQPPSDLEVVEVSRRLKHSVVRGDLDDTRGRRIVLNFGHTFGHVLEAASRFRLRHGEAVALGLVCALDVGRALGVTSQRVAEEVTAALPLGVKVRRRLSSAFGETSRREVEGWLRTDKKREGTELAMVLLVRPGRWVVREVPREVWAAQLRNWRRGVAP